MTTCRSLNAVVNSIDRRSRNLSPSSSSAGVLLLAHRRSNQFRRLHFNENNKVHTNCVNKLVRTAGIVRASVFSTPPSSSSTSPGLYSSKVFDLTPENVDLVLEDVRPYLISDGGNVDVVAVEDGVVSLKLQGACGSCPSSTTTMKMGIERVLNEKFGDAIKDIRQVFDEVQDAITVEAVNSHLDILRPAIGNYGGSVEVISIENGDCHVNYVGPESIGSGIKAAIKEKFPGISNVIFTN